MLDRGSIVLRSMHEYRYYIYIYIYASADVMDICGISGVIYCVLYVSRLCVGCYKDGP